MSSKPLQAHQTSHRTVSQPILFIYITPTKLWQLLQQSVGVSRTFLTALHLKKGPCSAQNVAFVIVRFARELVWECFGPTLDTKHSLGAPTLHLVALLCIDFGARCIE